MKFEWNIFQDSLHCSSSTKSNSSWTIRASQRKSKDGLSSWRWCSMTWYGELKRMNRNVLVTPHSCLYLQKDFPAGFWSFFWLGSEKKWYSTYLEGPRGEWDRVAELMMIKFRESGHPVFRATSRLSRGTLKSKGVGQLSIHFCADGHTIETVFRTILSGNQLSLHGAVSDVCEEYSTCQTRTERPVLAGQSDPWFEPARLLMTTPAPSIEIPAQENFVAKVRRTSGNASTTRSVDEDLYWCRILENSWSRTVLNDKGHWRVLTIYRTSHMSWVLFSTKWKIN